MKYFIDTEFIYTAATVGAGIMPLSIGVVAEDGREFYMVNSPALSGQTPDTLPPFVWEHVIPVLDNTQDNMSDLVGIAAYLYGFIGDDIPQFIGEYSAFDYVVLSTIMGGFERWPKGWPMYIRDLQQEAVPESTSATPHNALADARAVRDIYNWSYGEPGTHDDAG